MPEVPLVVVAEFAPPDPALEWIPYHVKRSWRENLELIRAQLGSRNARISAIILEPRTPHWPMRRAGFALAPWYLMAFNEHGEHFMLRPRSAFAILRHMAWRTRNFVRSQLKEGGWTRKQIERIRHPSQMQLPMYYRLALARTRSAQQRIDIVCEPAETLPVGISVVIPSRTGFELLRDCLPRISGASEIIVVDNGSDD